MSINVRDEHIVQISQQQIFYAQDSDPLQMRKEIAIEGDDAVKHISPRGGSRGLF